MSARLPGRVPGRPSFPLFPAPEGLTWVQRSLYGKWHLVRDRGGEYRCRQRGSPQSVLERTAGGFVPGGVGAWWRKPLCRWCCSLAGFDPDTGLWWIPEEQQP